RAGEGAAGGGQAGVGRDRSYGAGGPQLQVRPERRIGELLSGPPLHGRMSVRKRHPLFVPAKGSGERRKGSASQRPPYPGNDFELARFVSFGTALHLDNTFLENDYPQLSCLA